MKYYAVKNGRVPGIYNSWAECQKQIHGFKNASYKSFTSRKEAEEVATIAVAHDGGLRRNGAPVRKAQDFPNLDVAKVGEEGELAQGVELLGLGKIALRHVQLLLPEGLRQIMRERRPGRVADLGVLGHGARDDGVEHGRDLLAQQRWSRRLGVDDLVDDVVVAAGLER